MAATNVGFRMTLSPGKIRWGIFEGYQRVIPYSLAVSGPTALSIAYSWADAPVISTPITTTSAC